MMQAIGPLHWQSPIPLSLESGQSLVPWGLTYEWVGAPRSADDGNVVWVAHALSTNMHLIRHEHAPHPGWWETMVGPGKPLDTNIFAILCVNNLGSCFGSTGPASIDPRTQQPFGVTFPFISLWDMISAHSQLFDALNIKQLHTAIGGSLGGMLVVILALRQHLPIQKIISLCAATHSAPSAKAFRELQCQMVELDPAWPENPANGFLIARKLGHLSYRDLSALNSRFAELGSLSPYLNHNAKKFTNQFNVHSYVNFLKALNEADLRVWFPSRDSSPLKEKFYIYGVESDQLFPPEQQSTLAHWLMQAHHAHVDCEIFPSPKGHDAFLTDVQTIGAAIQQALHE